MAIDFSQVKTITIPEGSVTKITDSNGNTLWQGVGWHTIWEGNKTCSVKVINNNTAVISGNENNFAQTVAGTGYTPKIRITFSYSITNHNNSVLDIFYLNNVSSTTFQSSPITIDKVRNTSNNKMCGAGVAPSNYASYARAALISKKDTINNRLNFNLVATDEGLGPGNYGVNVTITFTVTKIEQYY